jgi:hypothetical protein
VKAVPKPSPATPEPKNRGRADPVRMPTIVIATPSASSRLPQMAARRPVQPRVSTEATAEAPNSVVGTSAPPTSDRSPRSEPGRLDSSAYQRGCAIATMVLELAPDDEELSSDFDKAFARWPAALVDRFEPWGIAPKRAVVLADLVMSLIEGALLLSRAAQSTEPLRTTVDALAQIIENETSDTPGGPLAEARPPRRRPRADGETPPLC